MALINLSNHPFSKWQANQLQLANELYGAIIDIPFPHINPSASTKEVRLLAQTYADQCITQLEASPSKNGKKEAVHIAGEATFVYACVGILKDNGIVCVASTTKRMVSLQTNEKKTIHFEFVMFRAY